MLRLPLMGSGSQIRRRFSLHVADTFYDLDKTSGNVSFSTSPIGPRESGSNPSHNSTINCSGCGIMTQTVSVNDDGYLPERVMHRFSSGWARSCKSPKGTIVDPTELVPDILKTNGSKHGAKSLRMLCMQCYREQNYRKSETFPPQLPSVTDESIAVEAIVKRLPDDAIVLSVIDVLDFESSIVPALYEALSRRRIRVISVLNKLDCIPLTGDEWKSVVQWSLKCSRILRGAIGSDGKLDVVPVSSESERGFDALEKRLSNYIKAETPRPIYVLGRVNSGKSSLMTRLMRYIGYKHMGYVQYKRKVGGITRSPIPGTTKDFIRIPVGPGMDFYDTPGIPSLGRLESHLSCSKDFHDLGSGKRLQPVSHSLKEGKTLLIGSFCRIEVFSGSSAVITSFISPDVTLHICNRERALDLLNRKAGTFLYPPHSDADGKIPSIVSAKWIKHRVRVYAGPSISHDDISIAGAGWISINGSGHKELDVWVPEGVQIFRRPAMLPKYVQRYGSIPFSFRRRARGLKINKEKKRVLQSAREAGKREGWRFSTLQEQENFASPPDECASNNPLIESPATEGYNIIP